MTGSGQGEQAEGPGTDWVDVAGLLSLAGLTAGAWLEWGLGVALLVFGGALGGVVLGIIFRRPGPPPENRR